MIHTWKSDADHIHLQVEIPPKITVAEAVKQLKSRSSQHLRKKFKFIREMYIDDEGIWNVGYFSSTIGLNEELIRKYIEHQGEKEKPQDEFFDQPSF
jgi:putative transposase